MGMYDIIIIKDKLPWSDDMWAEGLPNRCAEFQTRDLDNCLFTYKLENSRLLLQKFKEEKWVNPEPDNEYSFGRLQRTGEYWEDTNYHGKLKFYDYVTNEKIGNNDCWIEFTATFTNGQADKIEVFKFEKTDNTSRIKDQNAFVEIMRRDRDRWINKYFNYTKPVSWFRRWVWYEFWYKVGQFCEKMRLLW
jgi:hypothetical protein